MLQPEERWLLGGISFRPWPVVGSKTISFFVQEVKTRGSQSRRSVYPFSSKAVTDVDIPVNETTVPSIQMCRCKIIFGRLNEATSLSHLSTKAVSQLVPIKTTFAVFFNQSVRLLCL